MKKLYIIMAFLVLLISCSTKVVEKPDDLIPPKKMEAIIYDLVLLDATKTVDRKFYEIRQFTPETLLYKKHKIDSAQFYSSSLYYTSNLSEYESIYKNVQELLQKQKDSITEVLEEEKRIRDSIARSKTKQKRPN